MKKIFFTSAILLLFSCNQTYKISQSYLLEKTFEKKGYAEDQLSPEDIKANPDFAKKFLTSLASIEFVDKTNVNVSYWNNSQGMISSSGSYIIKNNEIILRLKKLGTLFGQVLRLENDKTLISNGQFEKFELKK